MSTENRFCDRCGEEVPRADSYFCPACGNRLSVAKDEPIEESNSGEAMPPIATPESLPAPEPVTTSAKGGVSCLSGIIFAAFSFIIFPVGWILGLWYVFGRKQKAFGLFLVGLGTLPLILILMELISEVVEKAFSGSFV